MLKVAKRCSQVEIVKGEGVQVGQLIRGWLCQQLRPGAAPARSRPKLLTSCFLRALLPAVCHTDDTDNAIWFGISPSPSAALQLEKLTRCSTASCGRDRCDFVLAADILSKVPRQQRYRVYSWPLQLVKNDRIHGLFKTSTA